MQEPLAFHLYPEAVQGLFADQPGQVSEAAPVATIDGRNGGEPC
jgi:hypothetical protein